MEKQFTFSIRLNGQIQRRSFTIPAREGYVITGKYCPNELTAINEGFSVMSGESEYEFIQDCQNIVNISNTVSDNDSLIRLGIGLRAVVSAHINRCGRLLFGDLLLYMDCFAYLLKATGFTDPEIQYIYPRVTKDIIDVSYQYIRDPHTLIPFKETNRYKILCKLANQ